MNKDTASHIVNTFEQVNKELFGLIPYLKENCTEEEFKKLKREIARIGTYADTYVYPDIVNQYPDLNPLKRNSDDSACNS